MTLPIEEKLLERRRLRLSFGGSVAMDYGDERSLINPDGPEAAAIIKALSEALEHAAELFRKYEDMHREKAMKSADPAETNSRQDKAERNRDAAEVCEAALTLAQGDSR